MADDLHDTSGGGAAGEATDAHKHDSRGAADLEKVTDYAEEKEIDQARLNEAMSAIAKAGSRSRAADAKAERAAQLASVKVRKEDVELLCAEFEVSKAKAEATLKDNNGNLDAALTALLNA